MSEKVSSASAGSAFPIREYINIIWHRRWGFIVAFIIVGCLGGIYTLRQPKIYEAKTAVIINPEPPTINPVDSTASEQWFLRDTYYDTQLRVMQSRNVAQRVIEDLGLADNLEFLNLTEIKSPEILEARLSKTDPVSMLLNMLTIESVAGTRLVNIRIRHRSPQLAAEIANAIAKAYSEQNAEHRLISLNNTFDFIDRQYKENEQKLSSARDSLNAFKENHKILYSNPIEQQKITNQRLDYLNNKNVEIETERQNSGYVLAELKNIPIKLENARAFEILTGTNSLGEQVKMCEQLQREEQKLLVTYLEKSPQAVAIKEQRESCQAGVLAAMKNAMTGLQARHQALVSLNDEVRRNIAALQKEALELDQLRLLYEQVESQKQEQERLFEQSQKKLNEVSLNKLLDVNNIRILDKAIAPNSPVSPNILINALITLAAAGIAGLAAVFLLELLDISVRSQNDIEMRAGLPFLGAVPKFPKSKKYAGSGAYRYILENPHAPVAESIRTLRTTLNYQLKSADSHVLLITSAQPSDGKTMTSINLAATSALAGQRVLLIEADLRRPRINEAFKLNSQLGLGAVISGEKTVKEVLMDTEIERLKLLPCGARPTNPAELFDSERFSQLLKEMRASYDLIIIDSPPVTAVTDALIVSRYVNGVIVVARSEKTSLPHLIRTRELLEGVRAPIMGVVLNGISASSGGYYGGYYYKKSYSET